MEDSQCTWGGAQLVGNKHQLKGASYSKGVHDQYLYSLLQELLDHLGATPANTASEYLFKVCGERNIHYLTYYQAQTFHYTVAKLVLIIPS